MAELFENNARSTLASGIGSGDTSIVLADSTGFPTPSGSDFFYATLFKKSTAEYEIVKCTNNDTGTNTLTVTRAQQSTTAIAFLAGDTISNRVTKAFLDSLTLTSTNVQEDAFNIATDAGVVNAYDISAALSPAVSSLVTGHRFTFQPANANTGASTLEVGPGAVAITKGNGHALEAGDLSTSRVYTVRYNGTSFQLDSGKVDEITTEGDLVIGTTSGLPARLPAGSEREHLVMGAARPEWQSTHPNPNLLLNGAFDIWQRGTSNAGVSASEYLADRWKWVQAPGSAARITHNRSTDIPSGLTGYSLAAYVTTADSSIAAGDYYGFKYVMEGYDAKELLLGTSGAKTVTLSFWVYAITAGTYCVGFRNAALDRSYVAEYTVSTPDTWEFKTITLTLDTSGTWADDNTTGLDVLFCIASGSTFQTTAGAWTAGNYFATASQVNGVPTTAKAFRLKNVKLEVGNDYTGFTTAGRNYTDELQMCRRYCQRFNGMGTFQGYASSANNVRIGLTYPVEMRTAPTLSLLTSTPNFLVGVSSFAGSGSTITASVLTIDGFRAVIDGFTGLTTLDPAQSNENSDMIELDAEL